MNDDGPIPEELIARSLAGDEDAFAALYGAYAPGVYRLAYGILLHVQDAEEVVQDVFVYVYRSLARFDPRRGAFRTWLYTITVSRCRNKRRRKWLPTVVLSHLMGQGFEPSGPHRETPEAAVARQNVRDALTDALGGLSPRLREAVALRYGQGLTYREMGEVLGCPPKTAESRIRLAHEALRRALSAEGELLLEELWGF
ncbi:MAG: sigma-70 family RNA polymerase sigma factor [Anaerolineae bacterium]|nr:sigma-70 family RNA polymerase sigma factor [Anaerolineae bacterium]